MRVPIGIIDPSSRIPVSKYPPLECLFFKTIDLSNMIIMEMGNQSIIDFCIFSSRMEIEKYNRATHRAGVFE